MEEEARQEMLRVLQVLRVLQEVQEVQPEGLMVRAQAPLVRPARMQSPLEVLQAEDRQVLWA